MNFSRHARAQQVHPTSLPTTGGGAPVALLDGHAGMRTRGSSAHPVRVATVEQHVHRHRILEAQYRPGQRRAMTPTRLQHTSQLGVSTVSVRQQVGVCEVLRWRSRPLSRRSDAGWVDRTRQPRLGSEQSTASCLHAGVEGETAVGAWYRLWLAPQLCCTKHGGMPFSRLTSPGTVVCDEQVVAPRLRLEPAAAIGGDPVAVRAVGPHEGARHRRAVAGLLLVLT